MDTIRRTNTHPSYEVEDRKINPSSFSELDRVVSRLKSKKDDWIKKPVQAKIKAIDAIIDGFYSISEKWVDIGLRYKDADQDLYARGWEWAGGPMPVLRFLQRVRKTLKTIETTGSLPHPGSLETQPNGQFSSRVYPLSLYEKISTPGVTVDVWMRPGISPDEVQDKKLNPYFQKETVGKQCLVLGAGNVSGIPVTDSLSKLFIEGNVVLLKMNPINEYLGPFIEEVFAPLISQNYFNVVYGGAAEGSYLCQHPDVDCIHLTGSDKTYEAIIFGQGKEGRNRKEEHRPKVDKRITAELGNVGPAIIVPGPWSAGDIRYQAEQIASHLCDSGSYSCSRTRVIIQHAQWELRDRLLGEITEVLKSIPARTAYYPGANKQYNEFVQAHPDATICGDKRGADLSWTMIPGLDASLEDEICFNQESFCPIIAETTLDATDVGDFIYRAVEFSNEKLWGTLSATIILHPKSTRDPQVLEAVNWAIQHLKYGTIAINSLPGFGWGIAVPPWGSYPGNLPWDIQSGSGFIHNTFMFTHPQKIVMRGPFRTWPRPIWFPSRSDRMGELCKKVASYEAKPSVFRLANIIASAAR